ncbi:MAG: beta-galactosidase [Bacteroidota bacterium]
MKDHLQATWLPLIIFLIGYSSCQDKQGTSEPKFNPGHYVAVGPFFELPEIKHFEDSAIQGVNKRFFWRNLEPEKGMYDFSYIEEDLAYCAKHDKQLIIFLCDRAFWIKGAMPDYLKAHEWENESGGFSPIRWHPEYLKRFTALGQAMAERFDAHPHFEGVAIQETALDMPEEVLASYGYTPEKYQGALLHILKELSTSFTRSNVFWYQNGIQGSNELIRQIADSISDRENIIMGGPDILPYRRWLRHTYKIYGDYQGKIKLFCSAQDDSYHHHKNDLRLSKEEPLHEDGYLSMEDIFLYARDGLHVQYLFWNHYYEGVGKRGWSFDDAIGVIQMYPVFNELR